MSNPTTGEWTTKHVHELINSIGADARIADEHNAALAAGREKVENLHGILGKKRTEIQQLRKQLSAEREKLKRASNEQKELIDCVAQTWEVLDKNSGAKAWPWGLLAAAKQLDAHNAALAAEKQRIWREAPDQPDIQEAVIAKLDLVHRYAIEKALAAEREKVKVANTQCKTLAALMQDSDTEAKQLRERLAAAVEALKKIKQVTDLGMIDQLADAALEKIGYPLPNGRTK